MGTQSTEFAAVRRCQILNNPGPGAAELNKHFATVVEAVLALD
jgi:hypothetical protein